MKPRHYLSRSQVAARIGVAADALSRYDLPPPTVLVGPVNEDGTPGRTTVRGWREEDIDKWNETRQKRRKRQDGE